MIERQQVNLRLERDLVDQLDDLARTEHVDRTEIARRILVSGVTEARIERSLRDYAAGRISASRAAGDAGINLYEMLDRIRDRGIPYEMDPAVFDRIDELGGTRQTVRVAEQQANYRSDSESGIDELRARYHPEKVRTLFVGESSPAQGTHFYRANSNLFRATREAYADAIGADAIPVGEGFLQYFADQGAWLVDLADHPVNRDKATDRHAAVQAGIPRLAETIRTERPKGVVVVKRDIADAVRQAIDASGVNATLVVLPFPVRQWASIYRRDLARFLKR
jgi:predicted transcriptional regulator